MLNAVRSVIAYFLITAYILIAIQLEERDLVAMYGDTYRDYQRRVPMLLPWPKRRV